MKNKKELKLTDFINKLVTWLPVGACFMVSIIITGYLFTHEYSPEITLLGCILSCVLVLGGWIMIYLNDIETAIKQQNEVLNGKRK